MQPSAPRSAQNSRRVLQRKVAGPLLFCDFSSPFSRIMTRLLSSFSTPYRGFPVPGARSSLRGAAWGTPRPIYVLGPALLPRLRATRALLLRPPSSTTPATDGWMAMFGAKEARGEATRLLCLIWPPACVSGYLGGAPKRGSTRYHTSAASSTGGDIKMLQRRIAGALTRCKSKPAGPWPYAPHHSHSTCSHHHSHHEHAACTSELGCARINGRYVSFF